LGTKANDSGQPKSPKGGYVDFTVVSNCLGGLVLIGVLIVLGIAEAALDGL